MPIEFRCTQCQRLLRTGDATAGKQARCPECGMVMTVPPPGGAGAPSLAETIAAGESPPSGPPAGPPPAAPPAPPGSMPGESPFEGAASPFAGPAMPPSPAASPENPYASPTSSTTAAAPPPIYGDLQMYAASRVAGPATALSVVMAIGIALAILGTAVNLFIAGFGAGFGPGAQGPQEPFPMVFSGGINVVLGALQTIIGILVIVGALKMKRLESYGFAMAAAVLSMIPYLSPCCCLGLPFGIWAIVVLSDGQVRAAFRS